MYMTLLLMLLLLAVLLPLPLIRRPQCSVLQHHASLIEHVNRLTRPAMPPLMLRVMLRVIHRTFIRQQQGGPWRRHMIRTPRQHDQAMRTPALRLSVTTGILSVTTGISGCGQLRGAGEVDDGQGRRG